MTNNVEALALEQLDELIAGKHTELENALEEGAPIEELNRIYKELKAIQIEVNLRKLSVIPQAS